jgi:DNA helicase II / ATP-dependent DNA helicase PcrA
MEFLQVLNTHQKEAVTHGEGPVFVVAGAGTGKTRTLTTRIAYLIAQGYDAGKILAVTFTNKAAKEMKTRVIEMIGPSGAMVWMHTFHAFGLQLLRRHISVLPYGYRPNFTVIDEDDGKKIITETIKSLNLTPKDYSLRHLKHVISLFKTNRLKDFEFTDEENIFIHYQKYLRDNQLLDFDDLLLYTYELLAEHESVRTYYQHFFEHILIDEFQDTDHLQYQIISILGQVHRNVFVVGDPDQSIYAFRGSVYQNNARFIEEFKAKQIILDQNYRSTNFILQTANRLIDHNHNRPLKKELTSDLGLGHTVVFHQAPSDFKETYFVLNQIDSLRQEGYKYSDIAILYRNNSISRIFEDALMKASLPYVIYGGMSFYERKEIKDAIAYVRVLMDTNQDFYLKRIINVPKRSLGDVSVAKLESHAKTMGQSMFESIESSPLTGQASRSLISFKVLMEAIQNEMTHMTHLDELLSYVLDVTGYMDMLKAEQDETADDRILNLKELVTVFKQSDGYYEGTLKERLQQLLDQIALYSELDKRSKHEDAIILSTIHQVKGLEFKAVFMVVLEEGVFPSDFAVAEPREMEEERRVCYVGITRAKRKLFVSYATQRMMYGQFKMHFPSRFIQEMRAYEAPKNDVLEVSSTYLTAGDKVIHTMFGEGIVVSMNDDIATIAFSMPHGIKKIVENHPALSKKAPKS